jgi:signal transduction histidine kinase
MAIILLARRFLARPINALQHAASSIAKQEAVETIAVHSHDEFGALARSMERMSAASQGYNARQLHLQDELRDINVALTAEIAERKHAEATREELILELEAKNAELERFTYTVSHDLKSPLITIRGFLGLLKQDMERGEAARIEGDIAHIAAATTMMGSLLDHLLDLSRIGRVVNPPQAMAFGELAHEALELVRQLAEREAHVVIAPDLPLIIGDRNRLVEVLQNLLDNAIKFLGDQPQPQITIGYRQEDEDTVWYVQDNGIGIEPRYHDKVFGLFERLDPTSEGTGIGLALVKRIIEVHGGRIWVESQPGQGATFYFTLPQADGVTVS